MCTGVEILVGASALLGAGTAYYQGQQQKAYANYQSAQAEADAKAAQGAAQVEAERIRKAGKQQRSEAIASLAASGVDVNSGTSLKIDQQIAQDSGEDAVLALTNGSNQAARLNAQAEGYRISGSQASTAGYLNAANTLLIGGTTIAKGWKRSGGTT